MRDSSRDSNSARWSWIGGENPLPGGLNRAGEFRHTVRMSTATMPEVAPVAPVARALPPFAVVLHNDDHNDMQFVVQTVCMFARMPMEQAFECMLEAHEEGQAIVLRTHREHAELVCEQFQSKGLTATVERA